MSDRDWVIFVSKHPDAAARAFHTQISMFLEVVVHNGNRSGLFSTCKAYYGTVEAQGCGTLHCHLLLWLKGNPNPQLLQDQMREHSSFRGAVFTWLEDIIKCELP